MFPKAMSALIEKNYLKDILKDNEFFSYLIHISEQIIFISKLLMVCIGIHRSLGR